jgi:hypothetical protein
LFRPATGIVCAQGARWATTAVVHPGLQDELLQVLAELDREPLPVRAPVAQDQLLRCTWEPWGWSSARPQPAPA